MKIFCIAPGLLAEFAPHALLLNVGPWFELEYRC